MQSPHVVPPEGDEEHPPYLREVTGRYTRRPVPRPTPEDTDRLVARLLAEEPSARATAAEASAPWRRRRFRIVRIACWRMRLLGPSFWIAGIVLLALAGASAFPLHASGAASWPPLVLVVPLTAVLGLAHALRAPHRGLREVEASTPVVAAEALTGLALAIIGFDCLLGLVGTTGLAIAGWAPFAALLAAWLGPLLLLTGISLPIALRWGACPAALIGGVPWLLLVATATFRPTGIFLLPQDTVALTLHLLAAVFGALLLLLTFMHGPAWSRPIALDRDGT